MQIRFADSLEPDGPMRCVKPYEREGFAAIQLLEVFQLHSAWTDYRAHPILKIAHPAEPAERPRFVSWCPICGFQIAGFNNSSFFVLQKVGDCMVHREPIHLFGQSAGGRLRLKCSKINWVTRSEEHTSELQSHSDLVCRLLLEKKKK